MGTSTIEAPGIVSGTGEESLIERYLVGRWHPYAMQQKDGTWRTVRGTLDPARIREHVEGQATYGTYTINADNAVRCITWDIDSGQFSDVLQLLSVLPQPAAVFESGRKGYHVIQTFEPRLPAPVAYAYGINRKVAAGLGHIESFPKQPGLAEAELGNLTGLPFGVHQATGNRRRLVHGELAYAEAPGLTPVHFEPSKGTEKTLTQHDGFLSRLFAGDPGDGRNNSLHRFAAWLRYRDFPEELLKENVLFVNNLFAEPLTEDELERTVLRPR